MPGILGLANNVRLTARDLHRLQRPQRFGMAFEPGGHVSPCRPGVPVHVLLEAAPDIIVKPIQRPDTWSAPGPPDRKNDVTVFSKI
jgi:hypothetical protein